MKHVPTLLAVAAILATASLVSAVPTTDPLKWSQPAVEVFPGMILGWDEPSMAPAPPMVADDFECKSRLPVTDLHWWGSYPTLQPGIEPHHPDGFLIRFWSDIPEDQDAEMPWSHPGQMLHRIECRNYVVERVGVDIDPWEWYETGIAMPVDRAYQYNQKLREDDAAGIHEWFRQEGTETDPKVYWISIQAIYDDLLPEDLWGWKTRPHFFNDDAVRGFPEAVGGPIFWEEIWGPGPDGTEMTWDLAFELTTIPEPATMSLLVLGGIAALSRRRRR